MANQQPKNAISLKIHFVVLNSTKTLSFSPQQTVEFACNVIREKFKEQEQLENQKDYGLFLPDQENGTGVWLEPAKKLEYYILRNGDIVEYKKKIRTLKIKMLDGAQKTMLVDDSQIVANMMVTICAKLGITNHDEYSLVVEEVINDENLDNRNYGTLTLKRKKEDKERDLKMEQLKRKLHTDDEVKWVDMSKTLREQGIGEGDVVLLKRKYFFSDQNIGSHDPVQLNLLYVQARDAIINGTHPIVEQQACEFAGMQCQIQFGDHSDTKHKSGLFDLKEFLPSSYVKVKGIEKKIFAEHKKCASLSEVEAKVNYTKKARGLKTYGMTFFLVKEKMKGKNKLVPRLLGVTKDSVLRLDEKTKEIMQTWPLTTVRRWGASPNTFTFDFGDYSDQYYSVQTTEAEQIEQIIGGYIDIILKKQQTKEHFGIEGDEGSTMFEESVAPHKATILQHETNKFEKINRESVAKPAIMRAGTDGERTFSTGVVGGAQYTTVSGQVNVGYSPSTIQQTKITSVLTEPQRALSSQIIETHTKIKESALALETRAPLPDFGADSGAKRWREHTLDTRKHLVGTHIAEMSAATAQVVTLTSGPLDEIDHKAVGSAISTIGDKLPEMTQDVKLIAALMDNSMGDKLLDATRKLCNAFTDLLKAAEPESKEPRQNLLNAASRVGEASTDVLATIGEDTPENKELQDMLMSLAKAVATTTASLVQKAKDVAYSCDDQSTQNRVIGAATQCALATSQLVACAKVIAPTLTSPQCQELLKAAVKEVAKTVEHLVAVCNEVAPPTDCLNLLKAAAREVSRSLNELLQCIQLPPKREVCNEYSVDEIYTATNELSAAAGDPSEMVKQARRLGQATAELIQSIKSEAESIPDSDIQKRLLAAAKTLADATAKMVEAARHCAINPADVKLQDTLRQTAEDLRYVTSIAATTPAMRAKLVEVVKTKAKRAALSAQLCISAARDSTNYNTNPTTRDQLSRESNDLTKQVQNLFASVKCNLTDSKQQVDLMYTAEVFLHPAIHFVQTAQSSLPTITEQKSTEYLSSTSQKLNSDLTELSSAISRAKPVCEGLGLEAANQLIADLEAELAEFENAVKAHQLRPLPGASIEAGSLKLAASGKAINQSVAQLVYATKQANPVFTDRAARETVEGLRGLTGAIRSVASTSDDELIKRQVIQAGKDVLNHSARLVDAAVKSYKIGTLSPNLEQSAIKIECALNDAIGCLPGQRDVDHAITDIIEWSRIIDKGRFDSKGKSYNELQHELNINAANLHEASTIVVKSIGSKGLLASSSKDFANAFHDLLDVAGAMIGQTEEVGAQAQMVHSLRNVSTSSSAFLTTAKRWSADGVGGRGPILEAARLVTDTINALVNVCTSSVPGQVECDNAIRRIQAMHHLLDNASEQINELSYYEAFDSATEKGRLLSDCMSELTKMAKVGQHERFAEGIKLFGGTICTFVEAAAQTAYFVGVSDATSIAGRPGLVDQAQFARASQAIQQGCATLCAPNSRPKEVLESATLIAKHTSAICNSCRSASTKSTNPIAKRQFAVSAKSVANATADLVKEIKKLDLDYSATNRQHCANATRPLLDSVQRLCVYANSKEFVSIPARISANGQRAQQPIIDSGRKLIDSSCNVIRASKSLIVMNKDPSTWHSFASSSKMVSESIKQLISSIKEGAPGGHECEQAAHALEDYLRTLNAATMDAISHNLIQKHNLTLNDCSQRVERSSAELLDAIEPLKQAAKFEAENLGRSVNNMLQYFKPLVESTIDAASFIKNSKQQEQLLDQAKTVTESILQLIYSAKDCGGNSKAIKIHPEIDEFSIASREALHDLVKSLEKISTQSGAISGVIDSFTRTMTKLSDQRASLILCETDNYVDYQTRMVETAKLIAKLSSEVLLKASNDPQKLPGLFVELSHKYNTLANDSIGATASATNSDVAVRLRDDVQQLGGACVELIEAGHQAMAKGGSGGDGEVREVGRSAAIVGEKVARVLATLQAGARGTQACINAASTVSGIIGDLETTIMFATAGNLNAENESESFADHRENILKTAKALVDDTKTLVAGAAAPQEELAVAAQNSVSTIVQLAEVVKLGAASLGSENRHSQEMLINAVKDVASALGDLIHATKAASGKMIDDPAMAHLKESAKVMVTNVTSLLKTVKAVEDEHTRGTRALESTIEVISQEMKALSSSDGCKPVTAEDLVRCTKTITNATAKSVAAGISLKQDDIIVAANLARKSISDMLIICKSAAYNLAETAVLRQKTLQAGHECARQFRELLLVILNAGGGGGGGGDFKQALSLISRNVAQAVKEIVSIASELKGSDWVDPDDPTVIAENELLGAAATIDAAAKKLANLRPRKSIETQNPDESLNFDEMIIEAAKSITAATAALVRAACAAQRELIDSGKVARTPISSSDDGQWSEGLISAAKLVAAATHSLVESANALVQGLGSEEKLISSAKQVASSTAQLLVACKVKAEGDTDATRRLQQAGTAVIRSTDNLVRAAQQSQNEEEERSLVLNKKIVGGIAQEINARSEVLRIEKQLDEARNRLNVIRQAKYRLRGGDTSGDDTNGYISSAPDGETSRDIHIRYRAKSSKRYNYDSSQSNYSPTLRLVQYNNDVYTPYDSENVNSLERNKSNLHANVNALNNAVYGQTRPTYEAPSYDANYQTYQSNQPTYQSPTQASFYQPPNYTQSYDSFSRNAPKFSTPPSTPTFKSGLAPPKPYTSTNTSPKPFTGSFDYPKPTFSTFDKVPPPPPPPLSSFGKTDGGQSSKEYTSSTYKVPGGYKTDSYKYESFKSTPEPIYTSGSEKYYSGPTTEGGKTFESYKNGSDEYQSSFSTNTEVINEAPILKDSDTLEQRMLKKSVTQQIVEKKTVQTTKTSKQESSSKTFRFE